MSRFGEIDNFLKYYASVFYENPNLNINSDVFYSALMNYGLSEEEINNNDIRENFQDWENYFKDRQNIQVFESPYQARFLQFHNKNFSLSDVDCVKIYLPFKGKDISECVKILFDFLEKNNIHQISKVSDTLRSDSVVLRISTIEEAQKVMDFVNNNDRLNNAINSTNPFVMRMNNMGLAMDDLVSYNKTVSYFLSEFFNKCKKDNKLDEVSLNDFMTYIINFYNDTFINGDKLNEFLDSSLFKIDSSTRYKNDYTGCLINYYQVIKLMITSLDTTKNLDNYINHARECNDKSNLDLLRNYFDNLISQKQKSSKTEELDVNISIRKDILDAYILYASKKYGNDNVIKYLYSYIKNDSNAITKDKNFRDKFSKFLSKDIITEITGNDLPNYVINIQNNQNINKMQILENVSCATFNKYGFNQLKTALTSSLSNNYSYFTDGNMNLRKNLIENVKPEEIINLCKLYLKYLGYDINELNEIDEILEVFCNEIQQELDKSVKKESL